MSIAICGAAGACSDLVAIPCAGGDDPRISSAARNRGVHDPDS